MRHVDFSPLYRSTVGFDRLFGMLDQMGEPNAQPSYPPYNITRSDENRYRISMAVAGFGEDDLEIEAKENTLFVKGEQTEKEDADEVLFRGIAARNFERRFQLADHVEVRDASLENGLLHIDLVREIPDAKKPRRIAIGAAKSAKKAKAKQIEGETA